MFHSTELANSIQSLSEKASNIIEKLDHISEDIKTLEKYLQERNMFLEGEAVIRTDLSLTADELKTILLTGVFDEDEVLAKEILTWKRDGASGKYRLMYQRYFAFDQDMIHHLPPDFSDLIMEKPLIETSVAIRVRSENALPALVNELEKQLS